MKDDVASKIIEHLNSLRKNTFEKDGVRKSISKLLKSISKKDGKVGQFIKGCNKDPDLKSDKKILKLTSALTSCQNIMSEGDPPNISKALEQLIKAINAINAIYKDSSVKKVIKNDNKNDNKNQNFFNNFVKNLKKAAKKSNKKNIFESTIYEIQKSKKKEDLLKLINNIKDDSKKYDESEQEYILKLFEDAASEFNSEKNSSKLDKAIDKLAQKFGIKRHESTKGLSEGYDSVAFENLFAEADDIKNEAETYYLDAPQNEKPEDFFKDVGNNEKKLDVLLENANTIKDKINKLGKPSNSDFQNDYKKLENLINKITEQKEYQEKMVQKYNECNEQNDTKKAVDLVDSSVQELLEGEKDILEGSSGYLFYSDIIEKLYNECKIEEAIEYFSNTSTINKFRDSDGIIDFLDSLADALDKLEPIVALGDEKYIKVTGKFGEGKLQDALADLNDCIDAVTSERSRIENKPVPPTENVATFGFAVKRSWFSDPPKGNFNFIEKSKSLVNFGSNFFNEYISKAKEEGFDTTEWDKFKNKFNELKSTVDKYTQSLSTLVDEKRYWFKVKSDELNEKERQHRQSHLDHIKNFYNK